MNSRRDIFERLSTYMDDLSPLARESFERDLDGIVNYSGIVKPRNITVSSSLYQAMELDDNSFFSTQIHNAIKRSFGELCLMQKPVNPDLVGVGRKQLTAFATWVTDYFQPDILQVAQQDASPTQFSDTLLIEALSKVLHQIFDEFEPGSKAEMRLAATLPENLTLKNVRDILEVADNFSLLQMAFSSVPPLQEMNTPTKILKACGIIKIVLQNIENETTLHWFASVLAERLGGFEYLVHMLLALESGSEFQILKKSVYRFLMDVALKHFVDGKMKIQNSVQLKTSELLEQIEMQKRLGVVLFFHADIGHEGRWFETGNTCRAELGKMLVPLLENFEKDMRSLFVGILNDQDLDRTKYSATLFSIICQAPEVFALQSRIVSMSHGLKQLCEVGFDRLFEKVRHSTGEQRQGYYNQFQACLIVAEAIFNDDYPALMRTRLIQEMERTI